MSLVNVEPHKDFFEIVVNLRGPSIDDLYDRIVHAARFPTREMAERIAAKINHAVSDNYGGPQGLDLSQWIWSPNKDACWTNLQSKPTAQRWTVGADINPN